MHASIHPSAHSPTHPTLWASTACYRDSFSVIANSHTLQFTTARTESSPCPQLPYSSSYCLTTSILFFSRLNWNLPPTSCSSPLNYLRTTLSTHKLCPLTRPAQYHLCTDRIEDTSLNSLSITLCVLLRRLPSHGRHLRASTWQQLLYSYLFRGRCLSTGLYATIIFFRTLYSLFLNKAHSWSFYLFLDWGRKWILKYYLCSFKAPVYGVEKQRRRC
jgi:hypothetical protein